LVEKENLFYLGTTLKKASLARDSKGMPSGMLRQKKDLYWGITLEEIQRMDNIWREDNLEGLQGKLLHTCM
jgi:hypothetical protein